MDSSDNVTPDSTNDKPECLLPKAPDKSLSSDLHYNSNNHSLPTSSTVSKNHPFQGGYLPDDDGAILTPEHAFVQYQTRSEDQTCQICNQPAVGFHHRAYVCEACKKFFMRHTAARMRNSEQGTNVTESICPMGGRCRVEGPGRGKCPHCRYRKCLELGMTLTPPGGESGCDISQIPCRVCGGPSSGFHFGALTCEGCKGFFRRTVLSNIRLECLGNNDCPITPANRNMCKSCRFQRCLAVGMSKTGSRIGRQPNAIKYYCAREISQLSSTTGECDSTPISVSLPSTSTHPTTPTTPTATLNKVTNTIVISTNTITTTAMTTITTMTTTTTTTATIITDDKSANATVQTTKSIAGEFKKDGVEIDHSHFVVVDSSGNGVVGGVQSSDYPDNWSVTNSMNNDPKVKRAITTIANVYQLNDMNPVLMSHHTVNGIHTSPPNNNNNNNPYHSKLIDSTGAGFIELQQTFSSHENGSVTSSCSSSSASSSSSCSSAPSLVMGSAAMSPVRLHNLPIHPQSHNTCASTAHTTTTTSTNGNFMQSIDRDTPQPTLSQLDEMDRLTIHQKRRKMSTNLIGEELLYPTSNNVTTTTTTAANSNNNNNNLLLLSEQSRHLLEQLQLPKDCVYSLLIPGGSNNNNAGERFDGTNEQFNEISTSIHGDSSTIDQSPITMTPVSPLSETSLNGCVQTIMRSGNLVTMNNNNLTNTTNAINNNISSSNTSNNTANNNPTYLRPAQYCSPNRKNVPAGLMMAMNNNNNLEDEYTLSYFPRSPAPTAVNRGNNHHHQPPHLNSNGRNDSISFVNSSDLVRINIAPPTADHRKDSMSIANGNINSGSSSSGSSNSSNSGCCNLINNNNDSPSASSPSSNPWPLKHRYVRCQQQTSSADSPPMLSKLPGQSNSQQQYGRGCYSLTPNKSNNNNNNSINNNQNNNGGFLMNNNLTSMSSACSSSSSTTTSPWFAAAAAAVAVVMAASHSSASNSMLDVHSSIAPPTMCTPIPTSVSMAGNCAEDIQSALVPSIGQQQQFFDVDDNQRLNPSSVDVNFAKRSPTPASLSKHLKLRQPQSTGDSIRIYPVSALNPNESLPQPNNLHNSTTSPQNPHPHHHHHVPLPHQHNNSPLGASNNNMLKLAKCDPDNLRSIHHTSPALTDATHSSTMTAMQAAAVAAAAAATAAGLVLSNSHVCASLAEDYPSVLGSLSEMPNYSSNCSSPALSPLNHFTRLNDSCSLYPDRFVQPQHEQQQHHHHHQHQQQQQQGKHVQCKLLNPVISNTSTISPVQLPTTNYTNNNSLNYESAAVAAVNAMSNFPIPSSITSNTVLDQSSIKSGCHVNNNNNITTNATTTTTNNNNNNNNNDNDNTNLTNGRNISSSDLSTGVCKKDVINLPRGKNGMSLASITVQYFSERLHAAAKYMINERRNIYSGEIPTNGRQLRLNDRVEVVWNEMMKHFETHSRLVVQFVKYIPGFCHMSICDQRQLVRNAMYPLMLLELSRNFKQDDMSYNYFDFSASEREIILAHFPTFRAISDHLVQSGEFINRLRLDNMELTILCAKEVFKYRQGLDDELTPAYLSHLADQALANHVRSVGHLVEDRLMALSEISPLLEDLNMQHHEVIAQLRQDKPQLDFPQLYVEMFQLSEEDQL